MAILRITEVHGIEANDLLVKFEQLSNQLAQIEKKVAQPIENILLSRDEVAKMLGISLVTLHSYSKKGIIPTYKIGTKVRFKQSEVFEAMKLRQSNK